VFDGNGRYQTQWNNLHRPCALWMPPGPKPVAFVGELGPGMAFNAQFPNLGPRISILDNDGKLLSRFGALHPGLGPDSFIAPHGIAVDSRGDLYVGEVSFTQWSLYWEGSAPADLRCFRKFRRVA
ncbi:MAG: hypothetical protein JO326_03570, partial [Acetobacteraceae bacterium]|nr:hypothetical protein [Acetobacteraceae bacterium]